MSLSLLRTTVLVAVMLAPGMPFAADYADAQLALYRQQGADQPQPARGRQLWYSTTGQRGCTTCHGDDPASRGEHATTGKTIEPMAPSVNPARYQDARKIEKWFLRNCKWTFGRECSAQEKADILTWLAGQ